MIYGKNKVVPNCIKKYQVMLQFTSLSPVPSNTWWFISLSLSTTKNKKAIYYQEDEEDNNLLISISTHSIIKYER